MTIKELAEFTGKTERTIRNWVNKAGKINGLIQEKISRSLETKKSSDFTVDEIGEVLNAGSMSKDAVTILMQNARQETTVITTNNSVDYVEIGKMIAMAVTSAMTPILQELRQPQQNQPKQLALPSAPDIKPRALLRQLVNDYAHSINITPRESWNELYKQFYYRCNESIKTKAKNLKIIPLDYLENENKLLTACSIMKDLIG